MMSSFDVDIFTGSLRCRAFGAVGLEVQRRADVELWLDFSCLRLKDQPRCGANMTRESPGSPM